MDAKDKNNNKIPQFPESFWRDEIEFPAFPKLSESIHADVGIVGGGITGITTAYLLSKQGLKVALIDAGKLFNGTTGHTTAKITAQHGLIYDELIQHFGVEKATLYYKANEDALQFVKDTITEHNIACDFTTENAYVYTNADKYITKINDEMKAYQQIGIKSDFVDQMPLDIQLKAAILMKDQAQFHPLKYLKQLVSNISDNGGRIYENTTAIDVDVGSRPNILTRAGHRITCDYVVSASHFPFYDGQGYYAARMYPERSYIIAVESKEKYPGGMYINAESPTRSIRSTDINGKDLWLIGGENHKTGQGKSMLKHYEALEDFADHQFGITNYKYRWSAQDLTTLDKLPYIGPISKEQPEVLIATGFRKWGMTNGTSAALILSDTIIKKRSRYQDLFSPSRFHADPDVKSFVQINADVSKHLIKGKLEYTSRKIADIPKDEGNIIRLNGQRTGVYKDEKGNVNLVDTTCTHLGCEVSWNQGDRTWDCPCHGSRYSVTGEVIEGPAQRPLGQVTDD